MRKFAFILIVHLGAWNNLCFAADQHGDLFTSWINVHLTLVRSNKGVPHVAYSRHFAYTAIAFYESVLPGDKAHRSLAGQLQELATITRYVSKEPFSMQASANAAYA